MELHYKDYYLKTITNNANGIKLVLGGTGLGKTHGMRDAVAEYLSSEIEGKRKFIYITNRHNLISEQHKYFAKAGLNCCYLKSNKDIILELFKGNEIYSLVDEFGTNGFFKFDETLKNKYLRDKTLNKAIKEIKDNIHIYNTEKAKQYSALFDTIDEKLGRDCDDLFKIFKKQAVLISRNDDKLHDLFKMNSSAWKLFPYLEFENNPDANILLVTITKVLKGFFDGKRDIKIASVKDKIIALDEFDFLEREILKVLCDEPFVINPLEFVKIFYEKFKHWSAAEFWDSREDLKGVRDKFNEVIKYLEEKTKEKGLSFPSVIDFRLEKTPDETSKPYMLFQTNEIITPKPFFLKEKNNSWYIQDKKTDESVSPFQLFNILAIATSKILGVFHYYQKDQNLVSEIIQNIWNQKNDNIGGRYEEYILKNCLYHRTKAASGRDYELYKDKSPYEIGYRLVKLAQRSNSFDPNSAELGQIELFTSPEYVIAKLSDENLVFALSATADIPRTLKCFNLDWLEKNATMIPLDSTDYEIIKSRRDKKMNLRKTKVALKIAGELSEEHPLGAICKGLLDVGFFSKTGKENDGAVFRYQRVMKIFNTLYQSLNSDKYAHLIFVTSFKGFRSIIDYNNNENKSYFFNSDSGAFSCNRHPDCDNFFQMTLNGKDCSVLLLSAEEAREIQDNEQALEKYRWCFEMRDKVFVITQYQSASNGINLPCFNQMRGEKDFDGIHLLESQHFWLDTSDDINDAANNEKQALLYLWKLKDAGQIDSSQFNECLRTRDPKNPAIIDIGQINNLYKTKADEKVLNAIALYHQAIGRIERRDDEILEVDVTLDSEVLQDFYSFLTSESFKELIAKRESITSSLILNIHQEVISHAKKLNITAELTAQKSILGKNTFSKNLISEFLNEIKNVQDGVYDEQVSNEIKSAWAELREVILQHDFNRRINIELMGKTIHIKRDFCFETKFVNSRKELFIDRDSLKVYREKSSGKKLQEWNLDSAYRLIGKHPLLSRHFAENGYRTSFEIKPNLINYILTPYIYQAILLGAIGEEAIKCILSYHGIALEGFTDMSNQIFEIVDAKVKDAAIYFDFKKFGKNTLNKFSLSPNDVNYDAELNSEELIEKAKNKYRLLEKISEKPILYIVNLYSENERSPNFYDANMKPVKYERESSIRIIPSILNPTDMEKISADFESSLKAIGSYEAAAV